MLTYLAIPYSHHDPAIRQLRFDQVNRVAARLINEGHLIFSPISHSHHIAAEHGLHCGWEFWRRHDEFFLAVSSRLLILKLDGWDKSMGVMAEIAFAEKCGIDIEFMEYEE